MRAWGEGVWCSGAISVRGVRGSPTGPCVQLHVRECWQQPPADRFSLAACAERPKPAYVPVPKDQRKPVGKAVTSCNIARPALRQVVKRLPNLKKLDGIAVDVDEREQANAARGA